MQEAATIQARGARGAKGGASEEEGIGGVGVLGVRGAEGGVGRQGREGEVEEGGARKGACDQAGGASEGAGGRVGGTDGSKRGKGVSNIEYKWRKSPTHSKYNPTSVVPSWLSVNPLSNPPRRVFFRTVFTFIQIVSTSQDTTAQA